RYIPGDQSAVNISFLPSNVPGIYPLYDDSVLYSVKKVTYGGESFTEVAGSRSTYSTVSVIQVFDMDSMVMSDYIPPIYSCPLGLEGWTRQYSLINACWVGDFSSFSPGYEFVGEIYQAASGYSGPGPFPTEPTCLYSSYHLACYDLSSPDSISEIWNNEYDSDPEIQFIFSDSFYTNRFFACKGGRIYEYRSYDGTVVDSSNSPGYYGIPMAYKSIETGGVRYLITHSANTLRLYSVDVVVPVEEDSPYLLPAVFRMGEPYPNPYNARVNIPLTIAAKGNLIVEAYNVLGQQVEVIYDGEVRAGELNLVWDSSKFSSGVYFIKASSGISSVATKAILLK
ncbi:MAG: T9SS type A sorting domain-containing protein, partial [Candidatus Zixiibacteriota bacterium]